MGGVGRIGGEGIVDMLCGGTGGMREGANEVVALVRVKLCMLALCLGTEVGDTEGAGKGGTGGESGG